MVDYTRVPESHTYIISGKYANTSTCCELLLVGEKHASTEHVKICFACCQLCVNFIITFPALKTCSWAACVRAVLPVGLYVGALKVRAGGLHLEFFSAWQVQFSSKKLSENDLFWAPGSSVVEAVLLRLWVLCGGFCLPPSACHPPFPFISWAVQSFKII